MKNISTLLAITVIIIAFFSSGMASGSIMIFEEVSGAGCEIEFNEWSRQNKCELTLSKGDEILINVACDSGRVDLDILSKSGAEVYSGNGIGSSRFTVKVSEGGEYVFSLRGDNATGKVYIKSLADSNKGEADNGS
jgi:hypothetical protein